MRMRYCWSTDGDWNNQDERGSEGMLSKVVPVPESCAAARVTVYDCIQARLARLHRKVADGALGSLPS